MEHTRVRDLVAEARRRARFRAPRTGSGLTRRPADDCTAVARATAREVLACRTRDVARVARSGAAGGCPGRPRDVRGSRRNSGE